MSRKALGRGLAALIPTQSPEEVQRDKVLSQAAAVVDHREEGPPRELSISELQVNAQQPRTHFDHPLGAN